MIFQTLGTPLLYLRGTSYNKDYYFFNTDVDTAMEEAEFEKAKGIARKMIQQNEPIEKIIRYTDLPITVIDKLINELKDKLIDNR